MKLAVITIVAAVLFSIPVLYVMLEDKPATEKEYIFEGVITPPDSAIEVNIDSILNKE